MEITQNSSVKVIDAKDFDEAVQKRCQLMKNNNCEGTIRSCTVITQQAFKAAVRSPSSITQCNDGSSWVMSHFIGSGAYGSVYLAYKLTDGVGYKLPNELAIKSVDFEYASTLINEERMLKRLSNPYVVTCYGDQITSPKTSTGNDIYNLLLEYCSNESLSIFIRDNGCILENQVKFYANCILQGIQHIHSKKIIHCDIKTDNILLSREATLSTPIRLIPKIADFGLAMERDGPDYHHGIGHYRGTTKYMSPEIKRDEYLDYCADIWVFGCTVLEMFTGQRAWSEHGKLDNIALKVLIGGSNKIPYIPDWLSDEAHDFLYKCLERDPLKRWRVEALLAHSFLT